MSKWRDPRKLYHCELEGIRKQFYPPVAEVGF